MPRRYALARLVDLPRLDASVTVTLVTALLTAAADEARRRRLHTAAPPDTQKADHDEDSAWAALYGLLTAWMRLPGAPEAERAAAACQVLFPDGMRFTKASYQHEWQEAERRLGRLRADQLDQTIAALGGQRILDVLTAVHATYGQTLGYTQVQAAGDTPSVAEPLAGLRDELRRYVLQALAAVDPDEPATRELSERLLQPIEAWRSPSAKAAKPAAPAAAAKTAPDESSPLPVQPSAKPQ